MAEALALVGFAVGLTLYSTAFVLMARRSARLILGEHE